jgi:hypothetical protein
MSMHLVIDILHPPTLYFTQARTAIFKLVELRDYLSSAICAERSSEAIGMKVDIVTQNGLKPRIWERVLSEVVYV